MSTKIKAPEGWGVKSYGVKLKPGKPKDATTWVDVQGRPVIKNGRTWALQKQATSAPKKDDEQRAQEPRPDTDSRETQRLTPEEQKYYSKFADIAKEKIAAAIQVYYDDYDDIEEAKQEEDEAKRKYAPYIALSDDQHAAIGAYTNEWYRNMNSLLRKGEISPSRNQQMNPNKYPVPSEPQLRKAISDFASAIEQLPKAPQGSFSRVVSSTSDSVQQLRNLQEGDTMEDTGFSSYTAARPDVLDTFFKGEINSDQNIVFEVMSDQMRDLSPISKWDEAEHVLPPGAKFKVVGKQIGRSKVGGKHLVIKLQQITTQPRT